MRNVVLLACLAVACSASAPAEEVAATKTATSAIVGGKPSGDDENAAVFIVTSTPTNTLRCSGRIIAPGLVVSARHCFLKERSANLRCKPDGTPYDITDATGLETEPPTAITVYVGSNKANHQAIAVRKVMVNPDITVCRGDIAYLLLFEPGLDQRTPIRRQPPVSNEILSVTGWGFVDDINRTELPETRATVETKVLDFGPPALPIGVFTVPGNTLCLGDSGAAALSEGKLVGTYSRIDDADVCQSEFGRNFLTSVMSDTLLLDEAFAAIGEKPWFDGEEKPWLSKAGAACTADADCASNVCEAAACRAGCGPTGVACPIGQTCGADGVCASPPTPDAGEPVVDAAAPVTAPPPPRGSDGCAVGTSRGRNGDGALAILAVALVACRRPTGSRRSREATSCSRRSRR